VTEASSATPADRFGRKWTLSPRDVIASVFTAYTFAVSLPLIDILRNQAAFFVVRSSPPIDFFLFFLALALLAPSLLSLLVLLSPAAVRPWLHAFVFGGLVAALVLRLAKAIPGLDTAPPILTVGPALGLAALAVAGVMRSGLFRQLMGYAAFLPVVLAVLFFASSSIRAAMGAAGPVATTSVSSERPIVFIVFDELPVVSLMDAKGDLNRERFPGFARLAEHTTWFRNAYTSSSTTIDAVPSVLTGRYPDPSKEGVPTLGNHPRNLFTMFMGSHRIEAVEPITRLCPEEACGSTEPSPAGARYRALATDVGILALHTILPISMTDGLPPIDEGWGYFTSTRSEFQEGITPLLRQNRVAVFEDFIDSIDVSSRPTMFFLHSLLTHRPWTHAPTGEEYIQIERVPGISDGVWHSDKQWLIDQGLQRHLMQVGAADTLIGRLLDRLEQLDLMDAAILVVTADHGTAFIPGERLRTVTEATRGGILAVPLFITMPGREGQVIDDPVQLVDVLPTLADLSGADVRDWSFDGASLTGARRADALWFAGEAVNFDELSAARSAYLGYLHRRVPMSGGWSEVFRAGSGRHLLGADIDDLTVGLPLGWVAYVDDLEEHQAADLDSGVLPLMVTGYIEGLPGDEQVDLVIAVNGRVSAVTRTFDQERASMYSALTRLEDLEQGRREISVYAVEGLGVDDVLRPLEIAPSEG